MKRKRRKEKKRKGKRERGSKAELKGSECVLYLKNSRTCVFTLYFMVELKHVSSNRKDFLEIKSKLHSDKVTFISTDNRAWGQEELCWALAGEEGTQKCLLMWTRGP